MSHYFENDTALTEGIREIHFEIAERNFQVTTKNGVFCKTRLDYGTEVMLNAILKHHANDKGAWLDYGCGVGVVAVVLGTFMPKTTWTMTDINERAVELARHNTRHTGVKVVASHCTDGLSQLDAATKFDVIVTNPPYRTGKDTVQRLLLEAFCHLSQGGTIYYVGQRKQGIDSLNKWFKNTLAVLPATIAKSAGFHVMKVTKS